MRRRDLLSTAGVALASCARKPAAGLRVMTLGTMSTAATSPLYLAIERGYFRDAGIDLQPQLLSGSSQIIAMLLAGRLDVGFAYASPALFNATAQGAKVRVVMGREFVNPACGDAARLYARKAAFPNGTSDIRSWSGKKIVAGTRGGQSEFLMDSILRSAGVDPRKKANVNVPLAEAAAALVTGAVDGLLNGTNLPYDFSTHPEIVHEEAGAKAVANLQLSQTVFGPVLLAGDVAVGAAFVAGYLRGLREFMAGTTPQFLKDFVASHSRDSVALTMCRTFNAPDGAVDMKTVHSMLEWAVDRGYTQPGMQAESVVDTRFLDLAHKEPSIHI